MEMIFKSIYLFLCLSFVLTEPFAEYKVNKYYFLKKSKSEIFIDGKLNEESWNNANELSDFMSMNYWIGKKPTQKTFVKIISDNENIYIGVELFDDIDNITFKSGAYDDFINTFDLNSDYFLIEIDSDHDHESSYAFAVNSSNVKADYIIYDDEYIDDNWNASWDSSVSINKNSWSIEIKLPISIFRYSSNKNTEWGLNLIRYIKRNNEYMAWVVLPEEKTGIVSQYGHLKNINFSQTSSLNVKPYFGYNSYKYDDQFYPYIFDNNGNIEGLDFSQNQLDSYNIKQKNNNIGLDLNFNPNSFSEINITFKPDFGQINQDASEVNNTAYETYYDEKRNFFIENSLFFTTPIKIFYSRRIGDYIKYSFNNQLIQFQSELNSAFKYTSKINGYSYGILLSSTEPQDKNLVNNDIYSSVFRINKTFFNNNFKLGFMGTDFNHNYVNSSVYGLDYNFDLIDNKLVFSGQSVRSDDSSKKGKGVNLNIDYRSDIFSIFNFNDLFLDFWLKNDQYDKNLNIDDLGYLFRNNLKESSIGLSINNYKSLNKSKFIFQHYRAKNYSDNIISDIISINYNVIFNDLVTFDLGLSKEGNHYNDKFYDDYYNLDLNKTIKTPKDFVISLSYSNYKSDLFSYLININNFKNNIDDKGKSILIDFEFKPLSWIDINFTYDRLDYYETYHFLKIRQLPSGINSSNNFYQNNLRDTYSYLFINSDNLELYYTTQLSAYVNDYLSFQLYGEYFIHEDNWNDESNLFEIQQIDNDFTYPNPITGLNSTLINFNNDKIKYSSLYNSVMVNFVTKWDYNNSSRIYFVYSLSKAVNGKIFNNFIDLIDYDNNLNDLDEVSPEIYFNQSLSFKVEFYF